MKKKYDVWKRLKSHTGFVWINGLPTASDEVWAVEIQRSPQVKEFRMIPLANADELTEIFDGKRASRDYPTSDHTDSGSSDNHVPVPVPVPVPVSFPPVPIPISVPSRLRSLPSPPRTAGNVHQRVSSQTDKFSESIKKALSADVLSERSPIERAVNKFHKEYSDRNGWSIRDKLDVCDILESDIKASVFLGLEQGQMQDEWLHRQLGRNHCDDTL
jgi:hypothetical protein